MDRDPGKMHSDMVCGCGCGASFNTGSTPWKKYVSNACKIRALRKKWGESRRDKNSSKKSLTPKPD